MKPPRKRPWEPGAAAEAAPTGRPVCTCAGKPPRCDRCLAHAQAHHHLAIADRGMAWAMEEARALYRGQWPIAVRWPPRQGRIAELAAARVADLARDPRIREALAVNLHLVARGFWAAWQRSNRPPWEAVAEARRFWQAAPAAGPATDPGCASAARPASTERPAATTASPRRSPT